MTLSTGLIFSYKGVVGGVIQVLIISGVFCTPYSGTGLFD
jgi:hypothetical protein